MQVQQQAPQGHIICSGCGTLLMYPEGHPNVRCSICNVVTPTNSGMSSVDHVDCAGCSHRLMYRRGASYVQCGVCGHVSDVNWNARNSAPAYATCDGCSTLLRYTPPAESVRCSVCSRVTPLRHQQAQSQHGQGRDGGHEGTAENDGGDVVLVRNPGTFGEDGVFREGDVAIGRVSR